MRFSQTNKPPLGSALNNNHTLSRGLIGCWLFNEFSGKMVWDYSNCGHTGKFIDSPAWTPDGVDFKDDAIDVGTDAYTGVSTEMTIVARIYRHSYTSYPRIIDKYPAPSIMVGTDIVSNPLRFYGTIGGTSRDDLWETAYIPVNTWFTICARLGAGFQEAYINGTLRTSQLKEGPYTGVYNTGPTVSAYIGNRASDKARNWDGVISYVMLWNRALSPREIAMQALLPYAMFDQRPYWMDYVTPAAGGGVPLSNPFSRPFRQAFSRGGL